MLDTLELVGPCVVLGFSVGMEAFDELLSINVPWSQEFPGVRDWTYDSSISCIGLERNPQLSLATRMEDWASLGQHKRKPEHFITLQREEIQLHPPEHQHKLP